MNGKRYFPGTNAAVQLLAGNPEAAGVLGDASFVAISVICGLEFLAFPRLTETDKRLFEAFVKWVAVVDVCSADRRLKEKRLEFRSSRRLKPPDAIIAASASAHKCCPAHGRQPGAEHSGVPGLDMPAFVTPAVSRLATFTGRALSRGLQPVCQRADHGPVVQSVRPFPNRRS